MCLLSFQVPTWYHSLTGHGLTAKNSENVTFSLTKCWHSTWWCKHNSITLSGFLGARRWRCNRALPTFCTSHAFKTMVTGRVFQHRRWSGHPRWAVAFCWGPRTKILKKVKIRNARIFFLCIWWYWWLMAAYLSPKEIVLGFSLIFTVRAKKWIKKWDIYFGSWDANIPYSVDRKPIGDVMRTRHNDT